MRSRLEDACPDPGDPNVKTSRWHATDWYRGRRDASDASVERHAPSSAKHRPTSLIHRRNIDKSASFSGSKRNRGAGGGRGAGGRRRRVSNFDCRLTDKFRFRVLATPLINGESGPRIRVWGCEWICPGTVSNSPPPANRPRKVSFLPLINEVMFQRRVPEWYSSPELITSLINPAAYVYQLSKENTSPCSLQLHKREEKLPCLIPATIEFVQNCYLLETTFTCYVNFNVNWYYSTLKSAWVGFQIEQKLYYC